MCLRLSIFLVVILVFPLQAAVGPTPEILRVFREGERLVYDVSWLGLKAGEATLEVQGVVTLDGHQAYHLVTVAQSAPVISKIYRVDDRTESFLQTTPMRALQFDKNLREGRYRHNSQTVFDQEKGIATFRYLDFSKVPKDIMRQDEAERYGKYVTQEFPLSPGSLDELSVLYYVRTLPLQSSTTVTAKVFASRKNWELEVKVLGRETLETVLGRRETLKVEPLLKYEGIFQRKGRMIVWLTDDAERIPVQMQSEIVIGSFMTILTRREVGLSQARVDSYGGPPR
jgi:uncharacterized protein DUF3108